MNTTLEALGLLSQKCAAPKYSTIRAVHSYYHALGIYVTDDYGNSVRIDAPTVVRHFAEGARTLPVSDGWTV